MRWSVKAARTREMGIQLGWPKEMQPLPGSRFALRCGGAECIGIVTDTGPLAWDAPLMIDAGPNTLELEILGLPDGAPVMHLLFVELTERYS